MKSKADPQIDRAPTYQQYLSTIKSRHQALTLGQRLVLCRGDKTQEQFADELAIHVNTLARYERGQRLPTLPVLIKLQESGISLAWLLADLRFNFNEPS